LKDENEMKEPSRSSLENAVKKTMNAVTREVIQVASDHEDRLTLLKKNVGKVVSLKVEEIDGEENVRKGAVSSGEEFEKLQESIRKFGLLQPIVVELRIFQSEFNLVCVAGHRRLSAVRSLGQERIFCLLQTYEVKSHRTGAALSENLTREQLHFLDTAEGYLELLSDGWTEQQLAMHFERDPKTIKRFLVMAKWPMKVRDLIREHRELFSLRKVLHSFVQKSFSSNEELLAAVHAEVKLFKTLDSNESAEDAKSKPNQYQKRLESYFEQRAYLAPEVREEVENVLKYLKLIK